MATPSIVKPRLEYFCWNSIIHGISTRHGSHQVAQKFTSTTLPFRLDSGTLLPCKSLKVTFGALFRDPDLASDLPLAWLVPPEHPRIPVAAAESANPRRIVVNLFVVDLIIEKLQLHRKSLQKCQFT